MSAIETLKNLVNVELRKVVVDDGPFEKEPFVFYVRPFTLADLSKINSMAKGDAMANLACTLIVKALDENGQPLFGMGNKAELMRIPSDVVTGMINKINSATESDPVDYEKN